MAHVEVGTTQYVTSRGYLPNRNGSVCEKIFGSLELHYVKACRLYAHLPYGFYYNTLSICSIKRRKLHIPFTFFVSP